MDPDNQLAKSVTTPAEVGLCGDCQWSRLIQSAKGSRFFYCRRSETDPEYPKYPPLPVRECRGYQPGQDQRCHAGMVE